MLELLAAYSIKDIIIFLIVLTLAIKEGVSLWNWVWSRISGTVHKVDEYQDMKQRQEKIEHNVDLLIQSSILDFRSQLVKEHHKFCQLGWIDAYSLSALEDQYKIYVEEGGNSFAKTLMQEIRLLGKEPKESSNKTEGE